MPGNDNGVHVGNDGNKGYERSSPALAPCNVFLVMGRGWTNCA